MGCALSCPRFIIDGMRWTIDVMRIDIVYSNPLARVIHFRFLPGVCSGIFRFPERAKWKIGITTWQMILCCVCVLGAMFIFVCSRFGSISCSYWVKSWVGSQTGPNNVYLYISVSAAMYICFSSPNLTVFRMRSRFGITSPESYFL